jgi:hypothetical protein
MCHHRSAHHQLKELFPLHEGGDSDCPKPFYKPLSGERKVTFAELVAEPTRCGIATHEVSINRVFSVSFAIKTKAAIRSFALISASVFNENAACERRKLNEHGKLLSGDGRNCPLPELLCSFPCPPFTADIPLCKAEKRKAILFHRRVNWKIHPLRLKRHKHKRACLVFVLRYIGQT